MRFAKENYILIAIFLLALIIRSGFVLQSGNVPSSDAGVYDNLGLTLSEGKGYVDKNGNPHSHYPPFYPLFLSLIYRLFGHSYLAVRIIQAFIGACSCLLIYLIGKRIYSSTLGILAAFISVIYFPFIKSAELLLTELLFTFLLCLTIYYLLKIQEGAKFKDCIILGLLSGIMLLTKSAMLVFPLFIIPVFIYSKNRNFLEISKRYIVVLVFFILSIFPWIMRNYSVYSSFVPASAQGGITFYSSYRPPEGIFGRLAGTGDPVVDEAHTISSPVLRSNFLIRKTLDFIINNPKEVLKLEFKKILYLWAPFDWEIVGGRWFNVVYTAMLPFFGLGLILAFRGFKRFYPVLLPIIYFQIATLIFYGSPRFRLPIEPYIFILAIMGMIRIRGYILNDRSKTSRARP